ncbi:hypothetical protein FPV67DRAFT_744619 [Lyophyllum atratum]|nr:hypothetical protein FPV67DRAFT_744619 [Lyophyllum atratum]
MFKFFSTVLFVSFMAVGSVATPIAAQSQIVFSPEITYPKANTIWTPGSRHNVTWDTSKIPYEKQGANGLVLLGYNGTESENLDIRHPLAAAFPLGDGGVTVVVPRNIKPRDDYFVVLFGDSGNMSAKFKIRKL